MCLKVIKEVLPAMQSLFKIYFIKRGGSLCLLKQTIAFLKDFKVCPYQISERKIFHTWFLITSAE